MNDNLLLGNRPNSNSVNPKFHEMNATIPDCLRCHMNSNYERMSTTAQTSYVIRYDNVETGFWEKACAAVCPCNDNTPRNVMSSR